MPELPARGEHGALPAPGAIPGVGDARERRRSVEVPAVQVHVPAALACRGGGAPLSGGDGAG